MPLFVCSKLLRNNKAKTYEKFAQNWSDFSYLRKKKTCLFMRSFKGHDNPGCRITEVC